MYKFTDSLQFSNMRYCMYINHCFVQLLFLSICETIAGLHCTKNDQLKLILFHWTKATFSLAFYKMDGSCWDSLNLVSLLYYISNFIDNNNMITRKYFLTMLLLYPVFLWLTFWSLNQLDLELDQRFFFQIKFKKWGFQW